MDHRTKPPSPKGALDVLEHEVSLCDLAAELEDAARKLLADRSDRISLATGNQLALASIAARKVASRLALAREEQAQSRELLHEYQKLHGVGISQLGPRPRLQRNGSK